MTPEQTRSASCASLVTSNSDIRAASLGAARFRVYLCGVWSVEMNELQRRFSEWMEGSGSLQIGESVFLERVAPIEHGNVAYMFCCRYRSDAGVWCGPTDPMRWECRPDGSLHCEPANEPMQFCHRFDGDRLLYPADLASA
jgi:hypothetical protein